jgi:hypothetical protein
MSSYGIVQHHLRIDHLGADFVSDEQAGALVLGIHELTASVSRDGLAMLVKSLIPDEPLAISLHGDEQQRSTVIRVQATRLGFNPRIGIALRPGESPAGSILINVDPSNRWSPVDRVMLGIAHYNLDKLAEKMPPLAKLGTGRYRLNLQRLIREQLLDSKAPVRWSTYLERIEADTSEIRARFVRATE